MTFCDRRTCERLTCMFTISYSLSKLVHAGRTISEKFTLGLWKGSMVTTKSNVLIHSIVLLKLAKCCCNVFPMLITAFTEFGFSRISGVVISSGVGLNCGGSSHVPRVAPHD